MNDCLNNQTLTSLIMIMWFNLPFDIQLKLVFLLWVSNYIKYFVLYGEAVSMFRRRNYILYSMSEWQVYFTICAYTDLWLIFNKAPSLLPSLNIYILMIRTEGK